MPCAVDYILEGLAKNLELDRELGVFSHEFDREFLARLPKEREASGPSVASVPKSTAAASCFGAFVGSVGPVVTGGSRSPDSSAASMATSSVYDYVFLHHGPITGPGVEMMAKLVVAMKKTPETAPIVFTGEKPPAKIYVVLGAKALNKWYEGVTLAACGWFKDVDSEVLLVYSPEDIYRFGTNLSAAMVQKKREMWTKLQEAMRKVSG